MHYIVVFEILLYFQKKINWSSKQLNSSILIIKYLIDLKYYHVFFNITNQCFLHGAYFLFHILNKKHPSFQQGSKINTLTPKNYTIKSIQKINTLTPKNYTIKSIQKINNKKKRKFLIANHKLTTHSTDILMLKLQN